MNRTTKTELVELVRSFFNRLDWLTGGTQEESAKQAPQGEKSLAELAEKIRNAYASAGKLIMKDAELCRQVTVGVPYKLALYRFRHCGGPAVQAPSGYIQVTTRNPFAPNPDQEEAFPTVEVQEAKQPQGEPIPAPAVNIVAFEPAAESSAKSKLSEILKTFSTADLVEELLSRGPQGLQEVREFIKR